MEDLVSLKVVVSAILFSAIGLSIQFIVWKIFDKCTPGNLWEEIIEKKNLPLAIVVGAVTLAVAQVISAAIHG